MKQPVQRPNSQPEPIKNGDAPIDPRTKEKLDRFFADMDGEMEPLRAVKQGAH